MKTLCKITFVAFLTACTVSDDYSGSVYEITERSVVIRGAYNLYSGPAEPTPGIRAKADSICPGARYIDARPSPNELGLFLFTFVCPSD